MKVLTSNMKWIMLVSGVLTSTMIYAAVAPQAVLLSTFGEALEGPAAEIVVRNWGVLITLVGAMLIYGAFNAKSRPLILTIAGVSKVVFIGLVLTFGRQYLGHQAGAAIVIDTIMVILYAIYLVAIRKNEDQGNLTLGKP